VKIVRRWLGTSSGAAEAATEADISDAAGALLDPAMPGRALLLNKDVSSSMDISEEKDEAPPKYLTKAAREVESWLITLLVRLLWKAGDFTRAFELSVKGIETIMSYNDEPAAASLFPLTARMFRLRSLAAESLHSASLEAGLRVGMAKAYNMAVLRRDVDTQATLLNCMLRDLLKHSQGT
jgi:hypothetical protein